jgi:hypothetical protein
MHQFPPPPKPDTFEGLVAKNRAAVEKLFKAGKLAQKAKTAKRAKRKSTAKKSPSRKPAKAAKKVESFPATWSMFKAELSRVQYRKCAFCEGWAIGQDFGDVEHFAPKAEIEVLSDDETTWGVERDNLANVIGRKPNSISATGYWWLAYEWDNYILACAICNQQWKRAIFPIKEARAAPPAQKDAETHYLLHPYRGEAPKDHLEYGLLGEVKPKTLAGGPSIYGRETIRTLGLDRPSLREQRRALASKIHKKIDGLAEASVARRLELLGDLHLEGSVDQPFCGMVRSIFEQRTGMTWVQLETELSK